MGSYPTIVEDEGIIPSYLASAIEILQMPLTKRQTPSTNYKTFNLQDNYQNYPSEHNSHKKTVPSQATILSHQAFQVIQLPILSCHTDRRTINGASTIVSRGTSPSFDHVALSEHRSPFYTGTPSAAKSIREHPS